MTHAQPKASSSTKRSVKPRSTYIRAFTLVELLVAITIFAVLSMLGWKVFDYLIKVKDRNAEHETHLFALQDAYQQVLRDSLQIIPPDAIIKDWEQDYKVMQENMIIGDSKSFSILLERMKDIMENFKND